MKPRLIRTQEIVLHPRCLQESGKSAGLQEKTECRQFTSIDLLHLILIPVREIMTVNPRINNVVLRALHIRCKFDTVRPATFELLQVALVCCIVCIEADILTLESLHKNTPLGNTVSLVTGTVRGGQHLLNLGEKVVRDRDIPFDDIPVGLITTDHNGLCAARSSIDDCKTSHQGSVCYDSVEVHIVLAEGCSMWRLHNFNLRESKAGKGDDE